MTDMTQNGWIVATDSAILSTGASRDEAIAAFVRDTGYSDVTSALAAFFNDTPDQGPAKHHRIGTGPVDGPIYAVPATPALLAQVDDEGGCIAWAVLQHDGSGTACTTVEAER